jgi:isopropylmalate/homocitrate/citramalate synthase
MASDYGALSCTLPREVERYIADIKRFLSIKRKNTHRNNIKTIENIISKGLKKTKAYMSIRKMMRSMAASEKQKNRYETSKAHVHFFKKSKMIFKEHYVYLYRNDNIDAIHVAHPQMNINLLDYLDITIEDGIIRFNLADVIKLIEHIKYVLFIDLSCSSTTRNVTNNETNRFKSLAKRIEGSSITDKMALHVNASAYNESPETKHLSLTKPSKSKTVRARSVNRSLNKIDKLRRLKQLTTSI